jgi:hypothetical protein
MRPDVNHAPFAPAVVTRDMTETRLVVVENWIAEARDQLTRR